MTKPTMFILFSLLVIGLTVGSDVANANLEILPTVDEGEVRKDLEGEADTSPVEKVDMPESEEPEKGEEESVEDTPLGAPELTEPEPSEEESAEEAPLVAPELAEPESSEEESSEEDLAEEAELSEEEVEKPLVEEPSGLESEKIEAEGSEETTVEEADSSESEDSEAESAEEGQAEESEAPEVDAAEEAGEEKETFLSFGLLVDVESGDMTYTIQGPEDGGWKSELKWPLDSVMYAGAEVSWDFLEKWRIHAEFLKSVTDDSGTMKDSDWFYGYFDDRVAIYSESSSTVDAYHIDANLGYRFLQKTHVSLGASIGYSYKHWDWTTGDGYQWTIDPFSFYEGPITGPGLTYKENVYIPYLGLELDLSSGHSTIEATFSALYSPFAVCRDEGDHLLREKRSEGDTSGNFFALRGSARWNLSERWSLGARASIESFDLEGDQTQYFYGGDNAGTGVSGIDMSVKGTQSYLGLTLGYSL